MPRYQKGSHIPFNCAALLPILYHHVRWATNPILPSWTPPCSRGSYSRCYYRLSDIWKFKQPMHRIPNMLRREARQCVSAFCFLWDLGRGSMRLFSLRSSVHGWRWQGRFIRKGAIILLTSFMLVQKVLNTTKYYVVTFALFSNGEVCTFSTVELGW